MKLNIQNFTSSILVIFEWSIFELVASFRMINYLSGECSGRLITQGGHSIVKNRGAGSIVWGLGFWLGKDISKILI